MSQLIKMLQKAHAGEIAAYHAYQGHWKALPLGEQRTKIQEIQKDELEHREIIVKILKHLGAKPSRFRDMVFMVIGKLASFLCKWSGWTLPMKGALLIEKIGTIGYLDIMEMAIIHGFPDIAVISLGMATKEEEHQEYFREVLND